MSGLAIKTGARGARVAGLRCEILLALLVAEGVWRDHGLERLTLTEATGGHHGLHSRHKIGLAVDLRDRDIPELVRPAVLRDLARRLGDGYDVVDEADHIHIEYDPER